MSAVLTGAEKRELKSKAQRLEAVIRVGHGGVSDAVVAGLDEALGMHGLVKVRFSDFKEERRQLSAELAGRTGSLLVQQVGNVSVFYRPRASSETEDAAL